MELKKILKTLLTDTSIFFTLIAALYAILMLVVNVGEEEVALEASRLLLIFLFALLAAIAQCLYRLKALHGAVRLLLHYGILVLAFYLCFLLPAAMQALRVFIGLFVFTFVYAVFMALKALFLARFRANAQVQTPYKSQFKR